MQKRPGVQPCTVGGGVAGSGRSSPTHTAATATAAANAQMEQAGVASINGHQAFKL
jgi:hypothetical protein